MAAFDEKRDCVVVRVVYDGPGHAGKTTNLKQLCEIFPVERRTELYTPGSLKGRTMFFDWLEVEGGKAGPYRIRFQLLTVPGQKQRNYRRRPLVEMADAIVFVCDCSPERFDDVKYTWSRLKSFIKKRDRPVPLVMQANKQDAPGAIPPEEIVRALRLPPDMPIVAAAAVDGVGVKSTVMTAMKSALKTVQVEMKQGGVNGLSRKVATAEGLFNAMLRQEDRRQALLEERERQEAEAKAAEADRQRQLEAARDADEAIAATSAQEATQVGFVTEDVRARIAAQEAADADARARDLPPVAALTPNPGRTTLSLIRRKRQRQAQELARGTSRRALRVAARRRK